jgi:very-short-patch-repair endonuclease
LGLVKSACQEDSLAEREVLEERPFEQEIQYYLETIVKKECLLVNYRMGDYYLDFVLVDPITKQPLLALECDGAIWHSDNQAYIHDIHRQKVLEQYGIEVYRIWAMAWWPEPTTALDEMKSFLMENYPLLIQ